MRVKEYAVIGHPIGHTMSPFIHKRLFELSGIKADYGVLNISPENLSEQYNRVLKNLDGYNITIPHKRSIIPLLDNTDSKAELYGSVNTVLNKDGEAKGFTTDSDGFMKALEYAGIPLRGRVVILGCGGAARNMAYEAALAGASLEFAVREQSIDKARKLVDEIKAKLKIDGVRCLNVEELSGDITTLINATPVGMSPEVDFQPVTDEQLKNCANVFDAIYNPLETKLRKKAKANGSSAEGGMSMLVWQAVVAHKHWDGSTYDVRDVERLCVDAYMELKLR